MTELARVDLWRALLDDVVVKGVLVEAGVPAGEVRLALERRWLEDLAGVDEEVLRGARVDVPELLAQVNAASPELAGLDGDDRTLLGRALRESSGMHASRVVSGHLLLALLEDRDPVVTELGLDVRRVRPIVARRCRRSG